MMYDTQAPFIAAFVILRRKNTVAFVLRSHTSWMNDYWGLPSGKVEKNESFSAGAIREAYEEVGATILPSDLTYVHTMHRHSSADMDWIDVFFEVKDWTGEPFNKEPNMHSELKWLDITNLPENVIPPVRSALQAIARGEVYSEHGWDA